jgi:hypothetical protein
MQATFLLTEGPARSGKSFARCAYFIPEFLRDVRPSEKCPALHISNFPVRIEDWYDDDGVKHKGMATLCEERYGVSADEVRERVVILDEEEMKRWQAKQSGPWEYFNNWNLSGCHLAFDEAHNFIPDSGIPGSHKVSWQKWLGEVGHTGCTVEILTQDSGKVAREILKECSVRISVTNAENLRDPFLRILISDWLELVAKFITGRYQSWCLEQEQVKVLGKWTTQARRSRPLTPAYFDVYDSHSKPMASGQAGKPAEHVFKTLTRWQLLKWFFRRNWLPMFAAQAVAALVVWLCFLGGGPMLLRGFFDIFTEAGKSVAAKRQGAEGEAPAVAPGAPPVPAVKRRPSVARGGQPDRLAELPEEVQASVTPELRKELEALYAAVDSHKAAANEERAGRAEAERALADLEVKLRQAFEVAAVGRDHVTFRGGYTYGVGETIDFGPYEGQQVVSVDWEQRSVVLTADRLRMGFEEARDVRPIGISERVFGGRLREPSTALVARPSSSADHSDVSGPLRDAGDQSTDDANRDAARAAFDHQHAGNAPSAVLPVAIERNGGVDSGRAGSRFPAGDGGSRRPDGSAMPARHSAAPGRGSDPSRDAVLRWDAAPSGSGFTGAPRSTVIR